MKNKKLLTLLCLPVMVLTSCGTSDPYFLGDGIDTTKLIEESAWGERIASDMTEWVGRPLPYMEMKNLDTIEGSHDKQSDSNIFTIIANYATPDEALIAQENYVSICKTNNFTVTTTYMGDGEIYWEANIARSYIGEWTGLEIQFFSIEDNYGHGQLGIFAYNIDYYLGKKAPNKFLDSFFASFEEPNFFPQITRKGLYYEATPLVDNTGEFLSIKIYGPALDIDFEEEFFNAIDAMDKVKVYYNDGEDLVRIRNYEWYPNRIYYARMHDEGAYVAFTWKQNNKVPENSYLEIEVF